MNRAIRVYHYSDIRVMAATFPNSHLRYTGIFARFSPSFHWSWRSSPSAHHISNVSDYFIQLSKNFRLCLPVYENSLSEIMNFHSLTSVTEGKGKMLCPPEYLNYNYLKVCNHIHNRCLYSALQFKINHHVNAAIFVVQFV